MDGIDAAIVTATGAEDARNQGPPVTPDYVERVATWMETERGYDRRDLPAFHRLAEFLAWRRRGRATKGLVLAGPNGNGKTLWLRMFAFCRMVSCADIARRWVDAGGPDTMAWLSPPTGYDVIPEQYYPLVLDELGDEPRVNSYGTKTECMGEVLAERYELFVRHGMRAATYISTNLSAQDIQTRYGNRVYSRLCEMCNRVEFTAPDSRTGEA